MQLTRVAERLGVTLLASPPALDDKELFVIEGSENWRSTPDNLEEREKWPKSPHRRQTNCKRLRR